MLLKQILKNDNTFSHNEKKVANYILNHQEQILSLSVHTIAKETFTSPSTVIRLSKKCGYDGFRSFKAALYQEQNYLSSNFQQIDPNVPFTKEESLPEVIENISSLLISAIQDTSSLIQPEVMEKVAKILDQSSIIYIFAVTNTASAANDFIYKMKYLNKNVVLVDNPELFRFQLHAIRPEDCALFISYSGETFRIFNLYQYLTNRSFPAISMTSIGGNSLMKVTDEHLFIATREKLSNKIAHYVSNESIHCLLDLLYSCLFHLHYDDYMKAKKELVEEIDFERFSTVSILQNL